MIFIVEIELHHTIGASFLFWFGLVCSTVVLVIMIERRSAAAQRTTGIFGNATLIFYGVMDRDWLLTLRAQLVTVVFNANGSLL